MAKRRLSQWWIACLVGALGACAGPEGEPPVAASAAPVSGPEATVDLSVNVTDSADPVFPGGGVTYTLALANAGANTAQPFTVTIDAPLLEFQNMTTVTGYNCTQDAGTKVWTCVRNATQPVGAAPSLALTGTTPVGMDTLVTCTATVTANAADSDSNAGNNQSVQSTTSAQNDPPVNVMPAMQTTPEDTTLTLSTAMGNAVQVSDPDVGGGNVRVSLSGTNGALTLGTTTGVSFTIGDGTADLSMQFSGTMAAVNTALNGLKFIPTANFAGTGQISVTTEDLGNSGVGGNKSDLDVLSISVTAVNDAPVLNTPAAAQSTLEDTARVFSSGNGNQISVTDLDAASGTLSVTLTVTNGVATLATITGLSFQQGDGTADASMAFTGTLASVNAALNGMSYLPPAEFTGNGLVNLTVDDQGNTGAGGAQSANKSVTVAVNPANDAPVNTVPGAQNIVEDMPLTFSAANANPIIVNDIDVGANLMQVQLSAASGTATLSTTTGLSFTSGDGTSDSGMVFSGSLSAVNTALAGLVFQPQAEFAGAASLTITSNDLGNTGAGGPKTDSDIISITVMAQNDAPVNSVPTQVITPPNTTFNFGGAARITIADVDVGSSSMLVTLTVTNGTLSLGATAGLTFLMGDGTADTTMQFSGLINTINGNMNNMAFTPTPGFMGNASLTITTSDQGATGPGGVKTDTDMVTIVVDQNDPPVHTLPGAQTTPEDTPLVLMGASAVSVADPDAGSAPLQMTLTTVNGAVTLATTVGLSFSAGDGTADTFVIFTGSQTAINAALTGAQFLPAAAYSGAASLTLQTSDLGNTGAGGPKTDNDTLAITVTAVDDMPVAVADAANVNEDTQATVDVLANDTGLEEGPFTLTIMSPPAHGNAVVANLKIQYTPAANYSGGDALVYKVTDVDGDSSTGTLSLSVAPVNDNPTANADMSATTIGVAKDIPVLVNDTDVDGDTVQLDSATQPQHGTTSLPGGGVVRYTPTAGYVGSDTFNYQISDGKGGVATGAVVVAIGADTDGDGLLDSQEPGYGTSPTDPDSDDDGLEDGLEVNVTQTSPTDDDSDDDGLLDGNEDANKNGLVDAGETSAKGADTDGDGLQDGTEKGLTAAQGTGTAAGKLVPDADPASKTSPTDDDSDDDGLVDGDEDASLNGKLDAGETDAAAADTDGDGLPDGLELGLTAPDGTGTDPGKFGADADPASTTDPTKADTDGGSKPDGAEDANHNGKVDAGETDPNDPADDVAANDDTDGDGVPNAQDNCPSDANGSQLDSDGDGQGDVCDATPNPEGGGGGGCGCTAGGSGAPPLGLGGLVLGLAAALVARRRRKH